MILWKSVEKDGLPKKSGRYLVFKPYRNIDPTLEVMSFSAKYGLWNYHDEGNLPEVRGIRGITHWAEINLPNANDGNSSAKG